MHQNDSICNIICIISNRVKSIDLVSNFPSIRPRGRSCDPSLQPGCVRKSGHLDVESQSFPRNTTQKKQGNLHLWTSFLSLVATSTIAESTTVKWPMPELEACLQLDNLQARLCSYIIHGKRMYKYNKLFLIFFRQSWICSNQSCPPGSTKFFSVSDATAVEPSMQTSLGQWKCSLWNCCFCFPLDSTQKHSDIVKHMALVARQIV